MTEHEKMMDEIASIIVKYGYRNLGLQQTLNHIELTRFVKDWVCIDIITDEINKDCMEAYHENGE